VASEAGAQVIPCPLCGGGSLVVRRGESGAFWGCSNYSYCTGKAQACPSCGRGALVRGPWCDYTRDARKHNSGRR
jgi:ssDNA-binding Zn-finger/Zn-ribbon topoisomerase 1